ncbi:MULTISPECIES: hypothetical protein [Acinetobacter calcoaceticus/baumannii complex]|uniref:hypothetical protein n=1 Tax=Acinetobacter calcoaceticus/baumannii complex TaxID=909768 RepID=UPI000DE72B6B|nr:MULTISPECIES: hypothetical protein [Acinetobacter calcoaceticus/baumannii complex]MCU4550009.1 hypothetical protein [Acinetobacter pittii]SSV33388.1 Uncharacterised protein [Acinetobacter nosocomialis]
MTPFRFPSEHHMQLWIESELNKTDGLADLISNLDDLENFSPSNKHESIVYESFKYCCKHLYLTKIVSANKNISLNNNEILKPDLVLYGIEYESLILVELKNINQPTRQAGTELGAYSCELRSYMPFLTEADLVHVIISVDYPVLVRHYIFQDIFWSGKKIICLMPVEINGSVKLSLVDIKSFLNINLELPLNNIVGYQLCLYDDGYYTGNPDPYLFDRYIEQMQLALSAMVQEGERLNSHGFAFLWKDSQCPNGYSLAPYSISVFNLAPFKSVQEHNIGQNEDFNTNIKKIIYEYEPSGHSDTISLITDRACSFLNNFCNPMREGFLEYECLEKMMLTRAQPLVSFVSWGIFSTMYYERVEAYIKSGMSIKFNDPEIGLEVVNSVLKDALK